MIYTLEVDDSKVAEQVQGILNQIMQREMQSKYGNVGNEISAAVKDLVYSHKDEIINLVVDRAVKEIVRKGLSKLLEKGGADV